MSRRFYLVAVCALLLGGCSSSSQEGDSPPEWDLYEPVVRHLLSRAGGGAEPERAAAYVSLPDAGSTEPFCRRFRGQPVRVLPYPRDPQGVTEQTAYIIHIRHASGEKVQWEGPEQARVFVLDYPAAEPPRCGTPYPIRVRRVSGRWVVAER